MADYRVISSDDHVMEPVDLWTSRGESKFKDRLPRVERLEVGDWWICDGRKVQTVATGTQAGVRFEGPETLSWVARVEELPPRRLRPRGARHRHGYRWNRREYHLYHQSVWCSTLCRTASC